MPVCQIRVRERRRNHSCLQTRLGEGPENSLAIRRIGPIDRLWHRDGVMVPIVSDLF